MVETTFNYLAPMSERPVYYTYTPPPGAEWRNTKGDRRTLPVHDARDEAHEAQLDREGFALARLATAADDLFDEDSIRGVYYPETEVLVKAVTGAARVLAFDHNLRSGRINAEGEKVGMGPIRYVHNDYTVRSGPQRVRELMGDDPETLLRRRFAVINVWKPITGPVREAPLAVCSASSMQLDDFVATSLEYPDRSGEVYSVTFNPSHRWFYYPEMQADEAMLLKCYDSDTEQACFTAHTAFDDPTSPADPPSRESIEVRTLAFFGGG